MFNRKLFPALLTIIALLSLARAEDRVQSELRFKGHNKAEKTAGVWVDGQYVGSVKELSGDIRSRYCPASTTYSCARPGTPIMPSRSSWSLDKSSK